MARGTSDNAMLKRKKEKRKQQTRKAILCDEGPYISRLRRRIRNNKSWENDLLLVAAKFKGDF